MNSFYKGLFSNARGIQVFEEPNNGFYSNHWLSAILVDEEVTGYSREDIRLMLLEDNIESRPLWKPMHLQPIFEKYRFFGDGTSEKLYTNGLCLPSGSNLTNEDKKRIKNTISNNMLKSI
jgi:dTDP-4-amino-4,6-dideoxygalactose transaminase